MISAGTRATPGCSGRPLTVEQWALATPAPGWTIAHQIGHLLWTDKGGADLHHRRARVRRSRRRCSGPRAHLRRRLRRRDGLPPAELLADWRRTRGAYCITALRGCRRAQAAVVRPADERRLDGDRPLDGDLGARPGCKPTPGIEVDPSPRLKSIAHLRGADTGLRVQRARAGPAG